MKNNSMHNTKEPVIRVKSEDFWKAIAQEVSSWDTSPINPVIREVTQEKKADE